MTLKEALLMLLAICQLNKMEHAAADKDLDDSVMTFTKKLLKQISPLNDRENFVMSPLAIQRQLLMAMLAVRGSAYDEIIKVIDTNNMDEGTFFKSLSRKPNEYYSSDNIYKTRDVDFRLTFKVLVNLLYSISPDDVDFEAPSETAGRISEETEFSSGGLIRHIAREKDFNKTTALCLVTVAYYSGRWANAFEKKNTRMGKFFNRGTSETLVSALYGVKNVGFAVYNDLKASAISMPYADSDVKLLILLPLERKGLKSVIEKVIKSDFSLILRKLKLARVALTLPQFSIDYRTELSHILPMLGASAIFSSTVNLDNAFDRQLDEHANGVSLLNKFHFDLNEYGSSTDDTESKPLMQTDTETPEKFFLVEHPFMFFIHSNETVHFVGRVSSLNVYNKDQSGEVQSTKDTAVAPEDNF